jgi:hypothetical protein
MGFEWEFRPRVVDFAVGSCSFLSGGCGFQALDAPNIPRGGILRSSVGSLNTLHRYELMLGDGRPGSGLLYDVSIGTVRAHGTNVMPVPESCSISSIGLEQLGQSHEVGEAEARSATARICSAC